MLRSFVLAIALSLASTTVLASNGKIHIDIHLRSATTGSDSASANISSSESTSSKTTTSGSSSTNVTISDSTSTSSNSSAASTSTSSNSSAASTSTNSSNPDPVFVTTTKSDDGTCSTYKNVDFLGWDIGSEKAGSIDDCCGLCQDKTGCSTYSWSDFEGGTCWLKNGHNDMSIYKEGVNSGIVLEKKVPYVFAYENNMDYEGGDNDIKNVPGSWIDKCIQPCQDTTGCGAISWNGDNGGTCWLKKQRGAAHQKDGVTSGVILNSK